MLMTKDNVLATIVSLDDLPTPPSIAVKLLELCSDPSVCMDELVATLSADPTLSARIIAFANSPLMSLPRPVEQLKQAVMVLGMRMVKTISLSFSIIETGKSEPV